VPAGAGAAAAPLGAGLAVAFRRRDPGINLCHRPAAVRRAAAAYGTAAPELHFSEETDRILLTAGALAPLRYLFQDGGTFVLVNGKIVTTSTWTGPGVPSPRGNAATLLLVANRSATTSATSRPPAAARSPGTPFARAAGVEELRVFTGIHLLEPALLSLIPDGQPYDTVRDLYPRPGCRARPSGHSCAKGVARVLHTGEVSAPQPGAAAAPGLANWTSPHLELDATARWRSHPGAPGGGGRPAVVLRSILLGDNRVARGRRCPSASSDPASKSRRACPAPDDGGGGLRRDTGRSGGGPSRRRPCPHPHRTATTKAQRTQRLILYTYINLMIYIK